MPIKLKPKYLFFKDEWMLAEDIPDADIFFFQVPMSCFASNSSYKFLKNYNRVITHYKKFHLDFYFGKNNSYEVAESILHGLFTKPWLGKDINKNVVLWSNKLIQNARHIASLPLHKFSNKQLWELYKKQDEIHTKLYTYGWLPVALDMFHNNFTRKVKSYLYTVCSSKEEAENAFIVLTTPTQKTIVAEEREEFLKIYTKFFRDIKQNKLSETLKNVLQKHSGKWGHLGYIYVGNVKPFGVAHYFTELKELAETGISSSKILKIEKQQLTTAKKRQAQIIKKFKISKLYQTQFETARGFAITKLYRRHAQLFHLYLMHTSLLPEIAKRLKLTRYQVQFLLMDEVRLALLQHTNFKNLANNRLKECLLYTEKDYETVYIGKKAAKIVKSFKKISVKNVSEISGQTAQPGLATGRVKIIIRAKDMKKFQKGDILVSVATDPDIVPAMKKAAAIVTEQGGITSHAAIVSRELGIPCIIGTKIATRVLKDGDIVEVDANKGIIKKIK